MFSFWTWQTSVTVAAAQLLASAKVVKQPPVVESFKGFISSPAIHFVEESSSAAAESYKLNDST